MTRWNLLKFSKFLIQQFGFQRIKLNKIECFQIFPLIQKLLNDFYELREIISLFTLKFICYESLGLIFSITIIILKFGIWRENTIIRGAKSKKRLILDKRK